MTDYDLAVLALAYAVLGNGVAWLAWWRLRRLARIVAEGLDKQAELSEAVGHALTQLARGQRL